MTFRHFVETVPWPIVAAWAAANAIPYLSALATRRPGWWTGATTLGLSFVNGLCAVLANTGTPVKWRDVLAAAAGSWLVAAVHHSKVLAGTSVEARLHAGGNAPRAKLV